MRHVSISFGVSLRLGQTSASLPSVSGSQRRLSTAALLLFVLLGAGCPTPMPTPDAAMPEVDSGVPDAGPPDAGRPPRDAGIPDAGFTAAPIDSWCQLRARAECSRDLRCGRLSASTYDGCLIAHSSISTCDQTAYSRGVAERRIQYLETEGVRCLNAFGSGSCEDTPISCTDAFTGLAPPDAGCLAPTDCNAFGFCDLYDGRCPHQCRPWAAIGEQCDGFTRRCDPVNGSCDNNDAGIAVCFPKKNDDDPCIRYDACGDKSSCVDSKCITRTANPGEACAVRSGFPFCTEEYFCRQGPPVNGVRPPGTCQRKSGLGGTCTGPGSCLPSLRCSTLLTTGTCLPKATVREGCINYDDCEDGLYCDVTTQRCQLLPDAGGDCSFDRTGYRCAPGNACAFSGTSDDRCVAWKTVGVECGYGGECLSNDCAYATLPDGGFGGTCNASCSQRADGGL